MNEKTIKKSSTEEIRIKFDQLAHQYTNLDTGQDTALDSPLIMELISRAAAAYNPQATSILDMGCGGGNYIVKLASLLPNTDVCLTDLSHNMLEVAASRVKSIVNGKVTLLQGDYRELDFGLETFDIIIASTTLHHLRSEIEWETVFSKVYKALKRGGSFWISDVILHENTEINKIMHQGWFDTLEATVGSEKLAWTKKQYDIEDTPQTLNFQLELMKKSGFHKTIILHKHFCFAAFGAIK